MTSTRLAVLVIVALFLLGAIALIGSLILGARGVPGSDTFLAVTTACVGGIAGVLVPSPTSGGAGDGGG